MFPGKFDIWVSEVCFTLQLLTSYQLHSHQIWHLFVVAAAACHYVVSDAAVWWHTHTVQGIYNMYQYRATEGCALEHSLNDSIQWS